jgi:hypothetical protein
MYTFTTNLRKLWNSCRTIVISVQHTAVNVFNKAISIIKGNCNCLGESVCLLLQKAPQKLLTEGSIVAFNSILPSLLDEEYQNMKQASARSRCLRDYQRAISDASRR